MRRLYWLLPCVCLLFAFGSFLELFEAMLNGANSPWRILIGLLGVCAGCAGAIRYSTPPRRAPDPTLTLLREAYALDRINTEELELLTEAYLNGDQLSANDARRLRGQSALDPIPSFERAKHGEAFNVEWFDGFDSFERAKEMSGARWDKSERKWIVPPDGFISPLARGVATESYHEKFHRNSAIPNGVVPLPLLSEKEVRLAIRDDFERPYGDQTTTVFW